MSAENETLRVGDRLESLGQEIVRIVPKPQDPRRGEVTRFMNDLVGDLAENEGWQDGLNLQDDPELKPISDPDVMYIVVAINE